MQLKHLLIALLVPLTWGFGFTFAKSGLGHFPPLLLMGMRFVLAALVLVWFVPIPRGYLWTMCWISFIAATLQYGLTFSGLALMQATPAVLLVQSEVIFGVIIAAVVLGETPTLRQFLGMVIALVGILVILGAPALDGTDAWRHAGLAWRACLGIWTGLDQATGWCLGRVSTHRMAGCDGRATDAVGVLVAGWQSTASDCRSASFGVVNGFISGAGNDGDWLFSLVLCFGPLSGAGCHAIVTVVAGCGYSGRCQLAG